VSPECASEPGRHRNPLAFESPAVGVGQRLIFSDSCPWRCPSFEEPFQSVAHGVGHFSVTSHAVACSCRPWDFPCVGQAEQVRISEALARGVGHCDLATAFSESPPEPGWFPQLSESSARGVGHPRACRSRLGVQPEGLSLQIPFCEEPYGVAVGVGHVAAAFVSCACPPSRRGLFVIHPSIAIGVGQEEESVSLVVSSDLVRSQHKPLRIEPERGQISEDDVEASNNESCDVLHEDVLRSNLANDASEVSPESAALALDADPVPGVADVLTREAASDAINEAAPRSAVEGGNVVPDRSLLQGRVFHPGHDDCRGEGFPLDVTHSSGPGDGEAESEVEASSSAEERENVERGR
jgi:hypothetical protein